MTHSNPAHPALANCATNDADASHAGTAQRAPTELSLVGREAQHAQFEGARHGDGWRASDALRVSDELHRIAFDQAPTGMAYVGVQQCFTQVNERLCEMTGYSAAELLNMPIIQLTHPEDRAHDEPLLNAFLNGSAATYEAEKRYVRKDGGVRWVAVTARTVADELGQPLHRVSVIRDITEHKHNVLELQRAHRKLQSVLGSLTDGLLVLDHDWRYAYINEQGARMLGMRPEQLVGQRAWDDSSPHSDSQFQACCQRAVASGQPVRFEELQPPPLNFWLERNCYPCDEGLTVYFRDITDRKRVEEAQRQNAALFTAVLEQAPMGVYVVDADFKLLQVNSKAMPVFATVKPLLGRDFNDVMVTLWGPRLGPQLAAIFRHTLDTGERYESPPFVERRHDLGRDEAFEWETQRVTLPDGRHGVVCYFHEVTERARALASLQASQERTRLATEATGVGIWEWDLLTNQVHWNAQMFRIYGVAPTPNGLVRFDCWRDTFLRDDLAQQERALQATIAQTGQSHSAFRIRRADDGELRHIQSVAAARVNELGKTECVVGTNLDVTVSVQAEDRLRRLASELADTARRKDAFLATLAHELRNPLAPLRNGLELIKRAGSDTALTERARAVMERQVLHMVRLIDDLLDVGRISHDKLELRRQRLDLGAVLRQAVEAAAPDIDRCGHDLTLALPREPIWLDADPVRLVQVVGNLLSNACKFTAPGGRIALRAEREGQSVAVTVTDSGVGIASDMLGKVFELFTQAGAAQQRGGGGLGIGLALVKRLVEMHGGSVVARSAGVGQGSEFVCRLPLLADSAHAVQTAQTAQTAPVPVAAPTPAPGWRILVVDDNRDAADSLASILSLEGHRTHIAHDGAQALEMATALRPQVVLLDIGLPKLNGYEVCRALREQAWGKEIVVVALTGWGQEEQRAKTSAAGFDAHVIKPVDLDELAGLLVSLRAPVAHPSVQPSSQHP